MNGPGDAELPAFDGLAEKCALTPGLFKAICPPQFGKPLRFSAIAPVLLDKMAAGPDAAMAELYSNS